MTLDSSCPVAVAQDLLASLVALADGDPARVCTFSLDPFLGVSSFAELLVANYPGVRCSVPPPLSTSRYRVRHGCNARLSLP